MKEELKIGETLIFTGQEYNLAKVLNYSDKFKNQELIIENILRCPCDKQNERIKFKGIERILSFYFF